ncbi:diphthamide biosynthesis enzyme Dph2 [Candidatus Alkanophaga liquidiphilum]|nr:Diphthamide synthase subunit DPH2 [Candidatus Alkanophaga liquidiphilum]
MTVAKLDFELEKVKRVIKERGVSVAGIQLPDGLKRFGTEIASEISSFGVETVISGRSCYGACDVDVQLLELVDVLFHFGHSEFLVSSELADETTGERQESATRLLRKAAERCERLRSVIQERCIFLECRALVDVKPVVAKAAPLLRSNAVGLVATVQHAHSLEEARTTLKNFGKYVVAGKGKNGCVSRPLGKMRAKCEGQILGCDFSAAASGCEEILLLGSGKFHAEGLSLYLGKKVVVADPLSGSVEEVTPKRLMAKRMAVTERASDARRFGVLLGMKPGQFDLKAALEILRLARRKGFKAYLISMDEVTREKLLAFDVDAFVSTACPRLAEDFYDFKKPVMTPLEFGVVVGERKWDEVFRF